MGLRTGPIQEGSQPGPRLDRKARAGKDPKAHGRFMANQACNPNPNPNANTQPEQGGRRRVLVWVVARSCNLASARAQRVPICLAR